MIDEASIQKQFGKFEAEIDYLKKDVLANKLEHRAEMKAIKDEITKKLDELLESNKNQEEIMNKVKGGWKALFIIGSVIIGLITAAKFALELLKYKP